MESHRNKMTKFQKNITLKVITATLLVFTYSSALADLSEFWGNITDSVTSKPPEEKGYWVDSKGQGWCSLTWDGSKLVKATNSFFWQKGMSHGWDVYNFSPESRLPNDGIMYRVAFPDSVLDSFTNKHNRALFVLSQMNDVYGCHD